MIKLPAASAAAILLCLLSTPSALAWCDEDCAYEAHEAAYERAYAREEAAEEGYVIDDRRGMRSGRRDRGAGRSSSRSEPRTPTASKRVAEPETQPTPSVQRPRTPTKVATENSSIATGTTQIAEDDLSGRETPRREVGCKTFFPSVGMTLSVPCD